MSDSLNITCISDTHQNHKVGADLPGGDMLIHAGDICTSGWYFTEVKVFLDWFSKLPYKYKIFIAGNHDRVFEESPLIVKSILDEYPDVIYLQDESITVEGIKIYGSPWQPEFFNWAFNLPRGKSLAEKWSKIPDDTDVLITHGPPMEQLDFVLSAGLPKGCYDLQQRIRSLSNLKLHIFGHIHQGHGMSSDGRVTYINASCLDEGYRYKNKPQIFKYE